MERYCIVCKEQFGCVIDGDKHTCNNCESSDQCDSRNHHSESTATGGICERCWGDRQYIKSALKIQGIASRLNPHTGSCRLENLSTEMRNAFSAINLMSIL